MVNVVLCDLDPHLKVKYVVVMQFVTKKIAQAVDVRDRFASTCMYNMKLLLRFYLAHRAITLRRDSCFIDLMQ